MGCSQPYGPEASAFAKRELEGEEVGLELDVQKIDPYGRLLAYVYLPDGQMFNETLLEEGYAQVDTFPPNVKYVDRFLEAQRVFEQDLSDPHYLDGDGDGVACEDLP